MKGWVVYRFEDCCGRHEMGCHLPCRSCYQLNWFLLVIIILPIDAFQSLYCCIIILLLPCLFWYWHCDRLILKVIEKVMVTVKVKVKVKVKKRNLKLVWGMSSEQPYRTSSFNGVNFLWQQIVKGDIDTLLKAWGCSVTFDLLTYGWTYLCTGPEGSDQLGCHIPTGCIQYAVSLIPHQPVLLGYLEA